MHKIWLITRREYLSRVKKKSFIVMTILGPLLIAVFYGIIIGLAVNQKMGEKTKTIAVIDLSGLFLNKLEKPSKVEFVYFYSEQTARQAHPDGYLIIPANFSLNQKNELLFKSESTPTLEMKSRLASAVEQTGKNQKLMQQGLRQSFLDSLKVDVSIKSQEISVTGQSIDSSAELNFGLGAAFAVIIYIFIFLYGVQVMRGVMEEKMNRIVEIIVSSVKPFQLMMGKILGIAMVGLTQFLIWIVLSASLVGIVSLLFAGNMGDISGEMSQMSADQSSGVSRIVDAFLNLDLGYYFIVFLFYFLFGYLLYSSMFAAIGSAVDSESDTQQFMMPVTLPLIISFATSFSILASDPNGSVATFMSIFPLTSPIIMMVRLPFNPPVGELIASMVCLVLTFILFTWLAGRIYKIGILMVGKKPTYRQLLKWMLTK